MWGFSCFRVAVYLGETAVWMVNGEWWMVNWEVGDVELMNGRFHPQRVCRKRPFQQKTVNKKQLTENEIIFVRWFFLSVGKKEGETAVLCPRFLLSVSSIVNRQSAMGNGRFPQDAFCPLKAEDDKLRKPVHWGLKKLLSILPFYQQNTSLATHILLS